MTTGNRHTQRVLTTVDSVGGVWRYALDLAAELKARCGTETLFLGFGPHPSSEKAKEALAIGDLVWLNLPSQAAGLKTCKPVLVVSHSCVVTWFAAVRGHDVPDAWRWQHRLNREGFDRADRVLAPSESHAQMLRLTYGGIDDLTVVPNGSRCRPVSRVKDNFAFAAARWWDEGKNGHILDRAAALTEIPLVMAGRNSGPGGQYLALRHARHLGELPYPDTMALMEKAAIVVSPSLYEPFGLAVLEAARAGAALILSDIPTYRELWDGAAIFVAPNDPQAFADAIDLLSNDRDGKAVLAEQAHRRSQAFTIEAQAMAIARTYDLLIDRSEMMRAAE